MLDALFSPEGLLGGWKNCRKRLTKKVIGSKLPKNVSMSGLFKKSASGFWVQIKLLSPFGKSLRS